MTDRGAPTARRRAAAIATLALSALLVVLVTVILIDSLWLLILGWLGIAVALFGLSRALTPPNKALWMIVAAFGLAMLLVSLVGVATRDPWAVVGAIVTLLAIGFLGAYALRARAPAAAPISAVHPVLFVNPKSGGGKATETGLADIARERGIDVRVLGKDDDLTQMAREAIAGGADALAMAGGDGSLGYVATAAIEAGVPFICIPAGTRNHFARDVGLDRSDVVGALDALDGELRVIDYATVNNRVFLNVASLGLYATVVSNPDYRDAKVETTIATLQALEESGESFDLRFTDGDGEQRGTADLVMVSNNAYTVSGLLADIGKRARLDRAQLGLLMLEVQDARAVARFAALYAAGQVDRFPGWSQWTAGEFTVESSAPAPIGVDGVTISMDPPLRFEIHPGGMTIAVPKGTPYGPGVSHLATDRGLSKLWSVAVGRDVD
jgi:diacylglycerol kinase family enzyme